MILPKHTVLMKLLEVFHRHVLYFKHFSKTFFILISCILTHFTFYIHIMEWGQGGGREITITPEERNAVNYYYHAVIWGKTSVKFGLQSPSKYCLDAGDIVAQHSQGEQNVDGMSTEKFGLNSCIFQHIFLFWVREKATSILPSVCTSLSELTCLLCFC